MYCVIHIVPASATWSSFKLAPVSLWHTLFFISFIEIFTYPFKGFNSVVFSIFRVVQPSPLSHFRTSSSPQKETLYPLAVMPHFPSPTPWKPLIHFLSLWICLHISCKWNHTIGDLLQLASFPEYNISQVHPRRSMCQFFRACIPTLARGSPISLGVLVPLIGGYDSSFFFLFVCFCFVLFFPKDWHLG